MRNSVSHHIRGWYSVRTAAWRAVCPSAAACASRLPVAVASAGPASTGIPVASAVNWHSNALRDPLREVSFSLSLPLRSVRFSRNEIRLP